MHILQKVFFKHALKKRATEKRVIGHGVNSKRKGLITEERGLFLEKEVKVQENKMGVMPVAKLLLTMSVPMMISMLVQALYNIVDSMFVARLSESALTAVSLAFPVQNLMIAVGTGTRALLERKSRNMPIVLQITVFILRFSALLDLQLFVDFLHLLFSGCRLRIRRSWNMVWIMSE